MPHEAAGRTHAAALPVEDAGRPGSQPGEGDCSAAAHGWAAAVAQQAAAQHSGAEHFAVLDVGPRVAALVDAQQPGVECSAARYAEPPPVAEGCFPLDAMEEHYLPEMGLAVAVVVAPSGEGSPWVAAWLACPAGRCFLEAAEQPFRHYRWLGGLAAGSPLARSLAAFHGT